jgi:hypothetical protein
VLATLTEIVPWRIKLELARTKQLDPDSSGLRVAQERGIMGTPAEPVPQAQPSERQPDPIDSMSTDLVAFQSAGVKADHLKHPIARRLVSTKELSEIWGTPESTLRYWRCAEVGPPYVKLGGRIKYDLADVELYVRANKRMPSVRAHGG